MLIEMAKVLALRQDLLSKIENERIYLMGSHLQDIWITACDMMENLWGEEDSKKNFCEDALPSVRKFTHICPVFWLIYLNLILRGYILPYKS